MVSLLVLLFVIIVVVAVLFYALDLLSVDAGLRNVLKVVVLLIAVLVFVQRSGLL